MAEVVIQVRKNGPYKVTGEINIEDMDGNAISSDGQGSVFLCRCGHSKEKPFCDGAHHRCGWKDAAEE